MEKFGANPSPDGAHEIDPTGEFSADYFEDFSIGLDNERRLDIPSDVKERIKLEDIFECDVLRSIPSMTDR